MQPKISGACISPARIYKDAKVHGSASVNIYGLIYFKSHSRKSSSRVFSKVVLESHRRRPRESSSSSSRVIVVLESHRRRP